MFFFSTILYSDTNQCIMDVNGCISIVGARFIRPYTSDSLPPPKYGIINGIGAALDFKQLFQSRP
jgi:hypothetical protein